MRHLFSGFLVCTALLGFEFSALAGETAEDNQRVSHYAFEKPHSHEAALTLLKDKTKETGKIMKKDSLSDSDLERVHEISYALEAAIDKIRETEATPGIDALDETIQALHYASENHDEAKTRAWFAQLEPAAGHAEAPAQKKDIYEIFIKDHTFTPDEIRVPAGEKIKLVVHNQDPTPEEFESDDFRREKIIAGNSKATIFVGPLKPGKYHFFGEFNLDKANGYLIVE